jgi:ABC-type glycerol-3-phosphate transport system permease component
MRLARTLRAGLVAALMAWGSAAHATDLTLVVAATNAFLLCWSECVLAPAILTRSAMKTLPLGLYQFFGEDTTDWGAVMACSAVTTLPALLLLLPLQRLLVSGLTAGSVKQ